MHHSLSCIPSPSIISHSKHSSPPNALNVAPAVGSAISSRLGSLEPVVEDKPIRPFDSSIDPATSGEEVSVSDNSEGDSNGGLDEVPLGDEYTARVTSFKASVYERVSTLGGGWKGYRRVGGPRIDKAAKKRRGPGYQATHACKICDKQFSCRTNTKRHILSHLEIKLHVCQCGAKLTTKQDLERHIKALVPIEPADHSIGTLDDEEHEEAERIVEENLIRLDESGTS